MHPRFLDLLVLFALLGFFLFTTTAMSRENPLAVLVLPPVGGEGQPQVAVDLETALAGVGDPEKQGSEYYF